MPKSRSKHKKTKLKNFKQAKQLFVGIAIAILLLFIIFLMKYQGKKVDAVTEPSGIDAASDMSADSPLGY